MRRTFIAGLATSAAIAGASVAFADTLVGDGDVQTAGLNNTLPAGDSGTATFYLENGGGRSATDPVGGCNAGVGVDDRVTVAVTSSHPGVIPDPGSLTIVGCGSGGQLNSVPYTVAADAVPGTVVTLTGTPSGGKDGSFTTVATFTVTVGAPTVIPNRPPTVLTAAEDAIGDEGDTLSTSGAFADADAGDSLTITKTDGAGTVSDNGDGTWSWSLGTDDDAEGTVSVQVEDESGATEFDTFDYTAANVVPVIGATSTAGNCAPVLSSSFTDVGEGDTHTGTVSWGDGSAASVFTTSPVSLSHTYTTTGTFPILVDVTDDDGGAAAQTVTSHTTKNIPGGVRAPNNADGTSVFKNGSSVPVKLGVRDCGGLAVGNLQPSVTVTRLAGAMESPVNEAIVSTSNADTGTVMRYSATDEQYIYNLATKSLSGEGQYRLRISHPTFLATVVQDFGVKR